MVKCWLSKYQIFLMWLVWFGLDLVLPVLAMFGLDNQTGILVWAAVQPGTVL